MTTLERADPVMRTSLAGIGHRPTSPRGQEAIAARDAERARTAATSLLARGTEAITTLRTDLEDER